MTQTGDVRTRRSQRACRKLLDTLPRIFDLGWAGFATLDEHYRVVMDCGFGCVVLLKRFDFDTRWTAIDRKRAGPIPMARGGHLGGGDFDEVCPTHAEFDHLHRDLGGRL